MPQRARKRRKPIVQTVDRTDPNFELDAVIDGMSVEHLQCRDFNHSWRPFTARRSSNGLIERELRCARCKSYKVQTLNSRGHIVAGKYHYADNYVIKGLGRVTGDERDHLRLRSIEKLIVEDTAEE